MKRLCAKESRNYLRHEREFAVWIVWTIGKYANGLPHFDLRSVTSTESKARLYSKILRKDKECYGESWDRVHIERRSANHLYGVCMREFREATGRKLP